ncbi:error-prone DNA polymerase [Kaistia dalseonensis]|uniref:Error-prone DNA polymerase n=1 Tax=Kaistia dalseonensis TaxID=410840 RepID=A0ABU0HDD2_9HYPH|nr:error-prone DNA polymerase [Kaistia dalseonensis]MCX5497688.1 error-prone DNA polymerase [Kaistia dalseonensis]MDQ0440332.1 error-prone DNA polymerase [Kaistia dalseonensis]
MTAYAELAVMSNFSFLEGGSHGSELVVQAHALGLSGIGIADRNTFAGIVRAHHAWCDEDSGNSRAAGFRLVVGVRLVFRDGAPDILAYPTDLAAYSRLCHLLSLGKKRAPKGECHLDFEDLAACAEGSLFILMPPRQSEPDVAPALKRLAALAPGRTWLGAVMYRKGDDRRRLAGLFDRATSAGVPLIAVNDVLYHAPERRPLQDVLSCIRAKTTIEKAGRLLEANAERHLKSGVEMARLFRDCPDAISETGRFLGLIRFTLDEIAYKYPREPVPRGMSPHRYLQQLVFRGAARRYPVKIPPAIRKQIKHELLLVRKLDYPAYFITVHDIVEYANDMGILCQGRGSAANSVICFCLGVTAVDPMRHKLLFERFLSTERKEPPDIDVDFEHERREEVIQYIYRRYGRLRAAICATVISYRTKSAVREVGKALGLSEDAILALGGTVWGGGWGSEIQQKHIRESGLDPKNKAIERVVRLAMELRGFPRHLSQHVGGFVLTRKLLSDLVPSGPAAMEDRSFIEWDKNDVATLKMMKVDILGLGMLTCIRKAFDLIEGAGGEHYELHTVPVEDPAVYDMLCKGDSVGVFQVESRAQMNMLPRLQPRKFYDLVIQVAIVRPGPIQGNMVHPYLKRRAGLEKPSYPSPSPEHGDPDELQEVLSRTLGVPIFQEQAMKLAMVAARFTGDQANGLRKAMATFRNLGTIHKYKAMMVDGMIARGYEPAFAENCFSQIEGFGEYGFPESHAASFAKLVYISAWIKCHHPAAFAAALLNAQPMGFYAPAQIVRDAAEHGVPIHPVDVNASFWDNTLEPTGAGLALRLGFRQIDGFREDWAARITAARGVGFAAMDDLVRHTGLERRAYEKLADADALRSLDLDRRQGLWEVRRLPSSDVLPLFAAADAAELGVERDAPLPLMPLSEHVVADYQTLRLSLKAHPMSFLRERLTREGILSAAATTALGDGTRARMAGVVLVRQRPGKGNVVFMTLEDETGIVNVVVWTKLFDKFRRTIIGAKLVLVEGAIQRSTENVVHLVARNLVDRTDDLRHLAEDRRPKLDPSRADEIVHPQYPRSASHPRNVRVIPKSRDFH